MRVYKVFAAKNLEAALGADFRIKVDAKQLLWGISEAESKDLKPDEVEELEFAALQEAVLVSAEDFEPSQKMLVVAADLQLAQIKELTKTKDFGDYAYQLSKSTVLKAQSLMVSELSAEEIIADEYAPELLWFDLSEVELALRYALGELLD